MATGIPSYKVILCGEYGAGKSSIFRRFLDNSFSEDSGPRSSMGLDHISKVFKVGEKSLKLELWDTAGIERFATLSSSYFQSASAAILCYALDDRDSFNMLSQHILEIIMHSETAKIFLCGNKLDVKCDADEQISETDVEDFKEQCDTVLVGTYKISCKTEEGVKDMFQQIAEVLLAEAEQKFDPSKICPSEPPPPSEVSKSSCCIGSKSHNKNVVQ